MQKLCKNIKTLFLCENFGTKKVALILKLV